MRGNKSCVCRAHKYAQVQQRSHPVIFLLDSVFELPFLARAEPGSNAVQRQGEHHKLEPLREHVSRGDDPEVT